MKVRIAARRSSLSKAQVAEVLALLRQTQQTLIAEEVYVDCRGDLERTTSLRSLPSSDFFTDAVDQLVLSGAVDVGIHSAKDLPNPLPQGLHQIALTVGIDSSDSLVLRAQETIQPNFRIATSSWRRQEAMAQLFPIPLRFMDLRGTIAERLSLLEQHQADGVVVAEAALIRLKLTHLPRHTFPSNVPLQGRLAVVGRKNDHAMQELFQCLDGCYTEHDSKFESCSV